MNRRATITMSPRFRSSAPCQWNSPTPRLDASRRYMIHGPIQPMQQPGFWRRLLSWGRGG